MNNKFSFHRFYQLSRRELTESKNGYISAFVISMGIFLFYNYQAIKRISNLYHEEIPLMCFLHVKGTVAGTYNFILMAAFLISIGIFLSTKNNAERISFYTTPATNLEKFLSRLFTRVFCVLIIVTVAAFLSEVIRIAYTVLLSNLNNMEMANRILFYTKVIPNNARFSLSSSKTTFSFFFTTFLYTLFALASGYWNGKRSGIKMAAIIIVIAAICALLTKSNVLDISKIITFKYSHSVASIVYALLSIINIWLSYRLFSHSTIKERKLLGVL